MNLLVGMRSKRKEERPDPKYAVMPRTARKKCDTPAKVASPMPETCRRLTTQKCKSKMDFRFKLSVNALAVGSAVALPDGLMRSNPRCQNIHDRIILVLLGPDFICERRPQLER